LIFVILAKNTGLDNNAVIASEAKQSIQEGKADPLGSGLQRRQKQSSGLFLASLGEGYA